MKRGFTLIELLAVLVILGILLAMTIPNIIDIIEDSREKSMITAVDNLITAADSYYGADIISRMPLYSDYTNKNTSKLFKNIVVLKETNFIDKLPEDTEGFFFTVYSDNYVSKTEVVLKRDGKYYSSIENLNGNCAVYNILNTTESNYSLLRDYYCSQSTCCN